MPWASERPLRLLCAGLALWVPTLLWADPAPVVDRPERDFGARENNQVVRERFTIQNTGDSPLEVSHVWVSCGCTSAFVAERTVAPGAQTVLEITFDLRGRKGRQEADAIIHTNAPGQAATVPLKLRGEAIPVVDVTPDRVFFGQLLRDASGTQTIDIADPEGKPFRVLRVTPDAPWLSATHATLNRQGSRHRVTLRTVPPMALGMQQGNVRIETSNPRFSTVVVPASASVVGPLSWSPSHIMVERGTGPVTRQVMLGINDPRLEGRLRVTGATIDAPGVTTQITPMGNRGIRVEVTGLHGNDALAGKMLVIRTNQPEVGEVRVPVRVVDGDK